jgi:electron transfer flavoprotein alpha subunit
MSNGILVFTEHRDGTVNKTSFEAIAAAQSLSAKLQQTVIAAVLGSGVNNLAQEIAAYDVSSVVYAENEKLANYTPDGYTDAMERVVRELDPQYVILPHTYLVRDFAPKLAARFGKGLISDCIRAQVADGKATFTRRIFLGKIDADVVSDGEPPVFATFQSGAFRGDQAAKGSGAQVETMRVEVGEIRMKPEAPFQEVKQAVDLSKADVIVAIGRGIKSKDNIALAEKLAEALGGDLAASRPICDAEWLPIDRQIGSSGQTVAPKLYIALGISGAIQHLVGMKNAGTIVAINKDPEAPIFDIADMELSAICSRPCRS